jgi:hypothetical protein
MAELYVWVIFIQEQAISNFGIWFSNFLKCQIDEKKASPILCLKLPGQDLRDELGGRHI